MGLSVVLEDEKGQPLDRVDDGKNVLHRLLPQTGEANYQWLPLIDWYGDTTFNQLQAPKFLEEWRTLTARAAGPDDASLLAAVERMAERVARGPHLYLKFYGD